MILFTFFFCVVSFVLLITLLFLFPGYGGVQDGEGCLCASEGAHCSD